MAEGTLGQGPLPWNNQNYCNHTNIFVSSLQRPSCWSRPRGQSEALEVLEVEVHPSLVPTPLFNRFPQSAPPPPSPAGPDRV